MCKKVFHESPCDFHSVSLQTTHIFLCLINRISRSVSAISRPASCCTTSLLWCWGTPVRSPRSSKKTWEVIRHLHVFFLVNALRVSLVVQRSVYKDLVLLLQKETFLSTRQLKSKASVHTVKRR